MSVGKNVTKLKYLATSAIRCGRPAFNKCPNCGSSKFLTVSRKYFVTALKRCGACLLMYRAPTDSKSESSNFYNFEYREGFTTDLPSFDELQRLKENGFTGQDNDYPYYIDILKGLGVKPGADLFDFGCSWGYGSYQFTQAGFNVRAYEISQSRANYGAEHLGVRLVPGLEQWARSNPKSADVFFSAHVLEHVPSPSSIIGYARRILRPGGLFVAFFPNGATACRIENRYWDSLWGKVHPNFLDDVFLTNAVPAKPRMFFSSPLSAPVESLAWFRSVEMASSFYLNDLRRSELGFVFKE